jgi:hypothetical protein
MAEDKKILLEVRGMTWDENCKFIKELLPLTKDMDVAESDLMSAEWMFKNVYTGIDINTFTPGEIMAICYRTIALSSEIRQEEIKNLKPSSLGNGSEAAIVEIAEESTGPEK